MAARAFEIPAVVAATQIEIRPAGFHEMDAIVSLQHLSLRRLGRPAYTAAQIESYLRYVPTLESCLIGERTYYVATAQGRLIACGGWSLHAPAYEAVTAVAKAHEHARIPTVRAMYVHPDCSRQGIARRLLARVEQDMRSAGHAKAEVFATVPGIPLYRSFGYEARESTHASMPDGMQLSLLRMTRSLESMR